jgi:phosphonate degradation associated HDIG domain protein
VTIVDDLIALLERGRGREYGDERVTQYEHALQCALLAEAEGVEPSLVVAALLHDIGHLLDDDARGAIARGEDAHHEVRAANFLQDWFEPAVTLPILLHVPAKRYLTATDPRYLAHLSPASVRSLGVQGGPYTATEVEEFMAQPLAGCAAQLRRWDDNAKVIDAPIPGLAYFRPQLEACVRKGTTR